jgi:DNA polymerase-3 subunit beta
VGKAVSGDYARPVLTGVLVEMSGTGVRFVATDSYRLHVVDADGRGELRAIVPGRAIAAVAKLIGRKATGTVSVAAGEFHVRFALPDGTLLSVRMIEAEFPNYSALIPTRGAGTAFRFDLAEAEAAIAGALSVLGKNGTQPVRLEIEPPSRIIRMTASSPDLGSWSGTLSQTAVWGENPVTVAFNPHYLLDTLRAAGDGATCEIRDGLKPLAAYSTDGKRTALLMPVRLPVSVS